MYRDFSPLVLASYLSIFELFFGCSPSQEYSTNSVTSDEPRPLEKKSGRHSFCGIEGTLPIEHPSCQVKEFREQRSSACEAERFIEKQSLSCPGSISHDVQEITNLGACRSPAVRPQCPAGYRQVHSRKEEKHCSSSFGRQGDIIDRYWRDIIEWTVTCERDEVLQSCRLQEFGPEVYKLCRHESHGPETFFACEVPGLSPLQHKECSYFLTPDETRIYVRQQQSLVESQADALLYFKSDILSLQNNKLGFACFIGGLEKDDFYQTITNRLKKIYAGTFGEPYKPMKYGLSEQPVELAEPNCQVGDNSNLCRAVSSYRAVHRWFEILREDSQNLLTESYLSTDLSLKDSLEKLLLKSNTMLSPSAQ